MRCSSWTLRVWPWTSAGHLPSGGGGEQARAKRPFDQPRQKCVSGENSAMNVQVFAAPELTGEARRFLAPFEVNSILSSMRAVQEEPLRGDKFLLYLSQATLGW